MFTFIIIADKKFVLSDALAALNKVGRIEYETPNRIVVRNNESKDWLAFELNQDIKNDYESDELEKIIKFIPEPVFALVEGRIEEINMADNFIVRLESKPNIMIDNNHGLIVDLDSIKHRIQNNEEWLYASS